MNVAITSNTRAMPIGAISTIPAHDSTRSPEKVVYSGLPHGSITGAPGAVVTLLLPRRRAAPCWCQCRASHQCSVCPCRRCGGHGFVVLAWGLPARRPSFTPFALARARPALTHSRIMPRSNSANTPSIWNIALPDAVLVSIACWCR
jgi:hypothetical protein